MKNATECTKTLTALLDSLPEAPAPDLPEQDDAVAVLVQSFLLMNTTGAKAVTAYKRLREHVVDFNDLRVTMGAEMTGYIGARYPQALDRCQRIRRTLRDVYMREHTVTLASLKDAGKRDVKKYLESLEGMTPYVSARVMLLSFDVHAVPVDERLRDQLIESGAIDESADLSAAAGWLARQVRAGDGERMHHRLQAWSESTPVGGARTRKKRATTGPRDDNGTAGRSRSTTARTTKKKTKSTK